MILENTPRNGLSPPTGPELKMDLDERIIAYALFETRLPDAGLFCAYQRRGGRSYAQKEQTATLP